MVFKKYFLVSKKAVYKPIFISIIILSILAISIASYLVLAENEGQTEETVHNRKIIENGGVIISAKTIESCSWKPDSINDGYKICEAIIEGYNPNNFILTVDKPGGGNSAYFILNKDVKNKKYDYYFSNQFELYNESLLNEICFEKCFNESEFLKDFKCEKDCSFEVERKRFVNWTLLAKDIKDVPANNYTYFAYKVKFELPQHESASYNFSVNYKKQDSTEIPIFLDPDVSACGTLNTEGATYTQTANIIPTADCILLNADHITYNGNGYWIANETNANSGIYSNGYLVNITIKNSNISMSTSLGGRGIELRNLTHSNIFNNTVNENFKGIIIFGPASVKNTLTNNTANSNAVGIQLTLNRGSAIINNTANSNTYGIYLYSSNNTEVQNNVANSNIYIGILLYIDSYNNTLTNNTANSNLDGIELNSVSNNILINNTANLNQYGISLYYSDNNTLTNNIVNSNVWDGFMLKDSSDNTLTNNTANLNRYGIVLGYSSDSNTVSNNNIWNSSFPPSTASSIVVTDSNYNLFTNNKINKSSGYGVTIYVSIGNDTSHNIFKNTNMTNIDGTSVLFSPINGDTLNNTFLNFSYNNETVDSGAQLIRKWYFTPQINESGTGTPIQTANVTIYNISDTSIHSENTDANGQIGTEEIIEYINNGGTKTYATPHTINVSKTGWVTNSTIVNLTSEQNYVHNVNLVASLSVNIAYPTDSLWLANNVSINLNFTLTNYTTTSCLFTTDNYATNTSITNCQNTTFNKADGNYLLKLWANDSSGTTTSDEVNFTIDTTYPLISYNSSSDSSGNYSKSDIFINITASDTNKDTVQWEFDGTNETFASSSGNYYWENKTGLADGTYSFYAWINDSAGNFNSTATRTITLDTVNPDISIVYPSNNTFTTDTIININYTSSDTNYLDSCWYSNDTMSTNTTLASCVNITTVTWTEGQHNVTIWANDSANNVNSSSVTFTIDTTYPLISYSGGTETDFKNVSQSNVYVNVSITETNEANITFYLYNSDKTLNTSTTYTDKTHYKNFTGLSDGFYYYNVTIYDNASNSNSTATRKIGLDNVAPALTLAHPKTQSYSTNESLSLNYTVSDVTLEVDSCWYRIVNSTSDIITSNTTISNCANTTFNVSQGEGTFTLTLYANDTLNNINSSSVTFGISLDAPATVLDYPTDNLWFNSGQNIYFNFTSTDTSGLSVCQLWGNWTGTWHKNYTWTSPQSAVQNHTILNLTDVTAIWNIWCNDTNNLENWALNNFTFGVDTIYPNLTLDYITTAEGNKAFQFNSTAQDINTLTCKYSIFYANGTIEGSNENVSFTCNAETTASVTEFGTYNLTVYASDLASNENSSTEKFTTKVRPPGGGVGGGPSIEDEEEEIVEEFIAKGFCGNGLCEPGESFRNCPEDCGGLNIDDLILSCFSDDPTEKARCIINQSPVLFYLGIGVIGFTFIAILSKTDVGKKYQKKIYAYANYQPIRRFRRKSWLRKYVK